MHRPIGVFDSGVGGLTVAREIIQLLPHQSIVYFGDTARMPYGNKSPATLRRFAREAADFLRDQGVNSIVVACNTIASVALDAMREAAGVPVVDVIGPGARAAVAATKTKRVAVAATRTTINTEAYPRAIKAIDPEVDVIGVACPLFVPLIEEGWTEGEICRLVIEKSLDRLKERGIDTLVLGCSHYPLLMQPIQEFLGPDVTIIHSGRETAKELRSELGRLNLLNDGSRPPEHRFFVSDLSVNFARVAETLLGYPLPNLDEVRAA